MPPTWSIDPALADAARSRLLGAKTVLMPTHPHVDADGLATPLALMHALAPFGVRVVPLIGDGVLPISLHFLPGIEQVVLYGKDSVPDYDLLCLADCSDRRRLGAFYTDDPDRIEQGKPIINIDHHVTNERYGEIAIVKPEATSTAEVLAELLRLWKIELTPTIAQCLLAGIYGDTLALRTEGTTSRTMRTAAGLIDAGASPLAIIDALFVLKPPSTVCLWEKAFSHVSWTGEVIWTEVTTADLDGCGADRTEAEGIVNFLAGTHGAKLAAILYESTGGWRVSMRSLPPVDVARIAAEFGGGGHPRAAGCTVPGGETEKLAFLAAVADLVTRSPFSGS